MQNLSNAYINYPDRGRQEHCYRASRRADELADAVRRLGFEDFADYLESKAHFFELEGDRAGGISID